MISTPAQNAPLDEAKLRDAVAEANIPTLLMVLHQLTGDEKWLDDPYRPTLTRGLNEHDDGGLPEDRQAEIKAAAVEAVTAWYAGKAPAVPDPSPALLERMMSVCMGEPVPVDYAVMMVEDSVAAADDVVPVDPEQFSVIIIGAGVAGLVMSLKLREAGITATVLEKNADTGGTWLENDYPGAGVDTPSYLYSFSFYPRNWTTFFGKRDEVLGYFQEMAEHYDLKSLITFNTTVTRAVYDEKTQRWTVTSTGPDGSTETRTANAVITAVGLLNRPNIPNLPGLDSFQGELFHSANWPKGLDVTGKRVAVVGTGASAMQVAPAIADKVGAMAIFQRSPQWVAPNDNYFRPVGELRHWLMENVPYYHRWYRFRLAWTYNDKVHDSLQVDPEWEDPEHSLNAINAGHRRAFTRYLSGKLDNRADLIEKAVPQYPPFGKRMLLDNGWYAALLKPNVELFTESVAAVTPTGVTTASGKEWAADIVVMCTGFHALQILHPLDIRGRNGTTIRDVWGDDDGRAFLGMTAPGFPNLFIMYGPNTNSGAGGSYIFLAESQARYIVQLARTMVDKNIGALEVRADVTDDYNREVDKAHETMVWTHKGMQNYYRNAAGRIVTNSPWKVIEYWRRTRTADLDNFTTEEPATPAS